MRQPAFAEVGRTQASSVISSARSSEAESGTATWSFTPSKLSARPNRPLAVLAAPVTVPWFAWPEESFVPEPVVSSKP